MASLEELRAQAREHARQLAAIRFVTVQELAARWAVDEDTVRAIPRSALPCLLFGKSRMRRFDPRDVEAFEERAKRGQGGERG